MDKEQKLQELLYWLNLKDDAQRMCKLYEPREPVPFWIIKEEERCSMMVQIIIKEAKEMGISDEEIRIVKRQVYGE